MAHFGRLGSYRFAEDVGDIRAANVYGRDGEKLGKIDGVIFDHDTMEVQYVVVDSGGWFEAGRFLLPADRMSAKELHKDDFSADATKEPVKSSPRYNEKSLDSDGAWKKYLDEFKKYWVESPVMHRKDTDRIITPPEEPSSSRRRSPKPETCEKSAKASWPSVPIAPPMSGRGRMLRRRQSTVVTSCNVADLFEASSQKNRELA